MSTSMPPMSPAPTPSVPSAQPDPTSIFVLFEGPWLIDQPSQGVLRATTFNELPMPGTTGGKMLMHLCQVGFGDASGGLTNPLGIQQPALTLNPGERWCITTPVPLLSQWKQHTELFDVPFRRKTSNDVFVYIQNPNKSFCVNPFPADRVVTFPTPDHVYLAGRLNSGTVADPQRILAYDPNKNVLPMPHVTAIFEYTRQSAPNLTLTLGGAAVIPLVAGRHLIFRMLHLDDPDSPLSPTQELAHLQDAFNAIWSRVATNDPTISVELTGVEDTTNTCGSYTAGFGDYELGLSAPPKPVSPGQYTPKVVTPDDCGGGGIVLG